MGHADRDGAVRAGVVCLALTAVLLAALGLGRGDALFNPSDGVYALTSRELLHGLGLYTDIATAQPPPVYLVGAALLGIHDSLTALRAGLELVTLATALLVWVAVFRLTGRAWLAVLAGVLTPLTPVMLHENALLTPETLGAPLLLGLALLAARPGRAAAAGVVGALAVATKLSFALPAVAVLLVAPVRARALIWFAGAGVALAAVATAIWGGDLWSGIVVAQSQSGTTALRHVPGLLAQEAWNALPLLVGAGLAVIWRARAADRALLGTVAAAAGGGLLLGLTVFKAGTYVNAVQVAEPPLLVLAVCGTAWAFERAGAFRAAAVAALLLLAAQSGSLLIDPADPRPYTRPFAASGPHRLRSDEQVRTLARAARACPAGAPYPGSSFVAFVARRSVPGAQPDPFILGVKENHHFAETAATAAQNACPADAPPT